MKSTEKRQNSLSGRIIETRKNYNVVDTAQGKIRATLRGNFRQSKYRVCAGDIVDVEISSTEEGFITGVHKRISYLNRPPVANLTRVVFVNTIVDPQLDIEAFDRFLFAAEAYALKPVIVFNKTDLLDRSGRKVFEEINVICEKIGYPVFVCSAQTGEGIDAIIDVCINELSAFAGLSGVGKSTILSRIFPDHSFKIGEVSGAEGRGTHTTTHVELLPLERGGYIADTPGFSLVDIPEVPETDVVSYFPELARQLGNCKFNNCRHNGEPGCAIQKLIDEGEIAPWRRDHYLSIYQEMKQLRQRYRKQ